MCSVSLNRIRGPGIYFVVFFLALYAMSTPFLISGICQYFKRVPVFKRKTPAAFFLTVITMFIIATIQTGVHWAIVRNAFITHGSSPEDTVGALAQPTLALTVVSGTMLITNTLLADCVLVRGSPRNSFRNTDLESRRSSGVMPSGMAIGERLSCLPSPLLVEQVFPPMRAHK